MTLATFLVALGMLGMSTGVARDGITVSLDVNSPTGSGPFTYPYTASSPAGDGVKSGKNVRIHDFGSHMSLGSHPATFAVTAPPSLVSGSIGVLVLASIYGCTHRRRLQANN